MKAIVPIKGLSQAKQRLSPLLSEAERRQLMKHMIDDVLSTICRSDVISGVVVISDDEEVRAQVLKYDARILSEPVWAEPGGKSRVDRASGGAFSDPTGAFPGIERLNQIFAMAMGKLAAEGEQGVLLLPADVPLITVENIQQMAALHSQPGVTIIPASVDGGTNAMMVSPPQLIALGYGHLSCQRHCDYARGAGIEPQVLSLSASNLTGSDSSGSDFSGLRLDIDTVDDLHELMSRPLSCRTQQFLLDSEIMRRLDVDSECLKQNGRKSA